MVKTQQSGFLSRLTTGGENTDVQQKHLHIHSRRIAGWRAAANEAELLKGGGRKEGNQKENTNKDKKKEGRE